jgi:hypothetical protein
MATFSPMETHNTTFSNDSKPGNNENAISSLNFQKTQTHYLTQQNQPKVQNKKHLNIHEIQQYGTISNSNRVIKFSNPTA